MTRQEQIVERIKKLLRLSRSMYQAEAELAMQRAFELAAKYQVDLETLDLGEDANRLVMEGVRIGMRLSLRRRLALGICQRHFNVNVIVGYPDAKIVGTPADIAVAQYVYEFLVNASERLCTDARKNHGARFTTRRERSFLSGFFYGISAQLKAALTDLEIDNTHLAVVLADRKQQRDRFVAENLRTHDIQYQRERTSREWLHFGYLAGRETSIRSALAQSTPKELPA